jgi:hypothetical protein
MFDHGLTENTESEIMVKGRLSEDLSGRNPVFRSRFKLVQAIQTQGFFNLKIYAFNGFLIREVRTKKKGIYSVTTSKWL